MDRKYSCIIAILASTLGAWGVATDSQAQGIGGNNPRPTPIVKALPSYAAPATTPTITPRPTPSPITATPYPTKPPVPTISAKDAGLEDVAMCTSLAAGMAALAWNAGAIGGAASWANTTVAQLVRMSPNTLAGLQMIAGALGYAVMPDDWMQLTLEQLFATVLRPGWDSCKLIVENFTSLPSTFDVLTREPDFWVPRPNDSPGIAMGRACAEEWRGGRRAQSQQGCELCCEQGLSNPSRQQSCKAVCIAQFGSVR